MAHRWPLSFLRPHMVEGIRELSGVSFRRTLIPSFMGAPLSGPKQLPKATSPHTVPLGLGSNM